MTNALAEREAKVKQIFAEKLGVDESKIKPQTIFIEDLGADSLDMVEITMALEDEFGLEIPDADSDKIKTFSQALDYIKKKLQDA